MKKDNDKNIEERFNIITIGDSEVGKTCILYRYIQNKFSEDMLMTLGFDKNYKDLILKNGKKIKLCLIDTAGQEKYKSLSKNYVKNADGVLFVFDLSNKKTFYNIKKWFDFFNENSSLKLIPKYLIGNKKDLPREVNNEMIEIILDENKDIEYKETSAKDENDNQINELFQEMGEKLDTFYLKNKKNRKKSKKVKLSEYQEKESRDCICL